MTTRRRVASIVLAVLGGLAVAVALVAGYARTAVLDSDQFADRAVSALQEPPVREAIAREITEQAVLRASRDLVAIRPLVETAAGAVVSTPAFQSLFRAAVRDLHRTVFTRDRSTATLTIADTGVLLANALERLAPEAAGRLPADFAAQVNAGSDALDALDAAVYVDEIEELAWLCAILAVLLLGGSIALARPRSRGVVQTGVAVAGAGAVVVLACTIGRAELLAKAPLPIDREATGAIWDAFMADLRTWALVTLGAGTVVAAAAASLLRPVDVRRPLRRAWAAVTGVPATSVRRVARALALIAAGVLIILERQWMLDVALILFGVFVLYQGVEELLRMVAEATERRRAAASMPRRVADYGPDAPDGEGPPPARRRNPAPWLAGGVAGLLVLLLVLALIGSGATQAPDADAGQPIACNGHAELCDRPLDEVVFPGTHNSMSGYRDWLFTQQEHPLRRQLDDGVRALMLDAYFGQPVRGRVLTELPEGKQDAAAKSLGRAGTEAALRVRDSLVGGNAERGERQIYMCHGFCEVGARPLVDGLREVTDFVVSHPDEVVLIVIQDEGPTPADIAPVVEESGLAEYVWRGRVGEPWPTLREMIDAGQRVLLMFENGPYDPAVPWYHDAYRYMQETPYHFTAPSQMSCDPNRGPDTASLFLVNHWIDTSPAPRPSNAARVNAHDFLLDRARDCERERGHLPNILAVDFYATGDLFEVTDELNGVAAPSS